MLSIWFGPCIEFPLSCLPSWVKEIDYRVIVWKSYTIPGARTRLSISLGPWGTHTYTKELQYSPKRQRYQLSLGRVVRKTLLSVSLSLGGVSKPSRPALMGPHGALGILRYCEWPECCSAALCFPPANPLHVLLANARARVRVLRFSLCSFCSSFRLYLGLAFFLSSYLLASSRSGSRCFDDRPTAPSAKHLSCASSVSIGEHLSRFFGLLLSRSSCGYRTRVCRGPTAISHSCLHRSSISGGTQERASFCFMSPPSDKTQGASPEKTRETQAPGDIQASLGYMLRSRTCTMVLTLIL